MKPFKCSNNLLSLLIIFFTSFDASAQWGAWSHDSKLRGEKFQDALKFSVIQENKKLMDLKDDGLSDSTNYITDDLVKLGDKQSYRTQVVSRLAKIKLNENLVRYEMQPLFADFKNGEMGQLQLAFPTGSHKVVIERDSQKDRYTAANFQPYMLNSANRAVSEAGSFIALQDSTKATWNQHVEINIPNFNTKNAFTSFSAEKIKNFIYYHYEVETLRFNTVKGTVVLSAKGFSVVDTDFNTMFIGGLSYDGTLKVNSGVSLPISGRKITKTSSRSFDMSSIEGLNELIEKDFNSLNQQVLPFAIEDEDINLQEVYPDVTLALAIWNGDSLAIAERRTNIAPLVAYAAVDIVDSAITLAVNAYGAVTGNESMHNWPGVIAYGAELIADKAVQVSGADSNAKYLGKTTGEWAGTAVGIAQTIFGASGKAKMAAEEAIGLIKTVAKASEASKSTAINNLRSLSKDAYELYENAFASRYSNFYENQNVIVNTKNQSDIISNDIDSILSKDSFGHSKTKLTQTIPQGLNGISANGTPINLYISDLSFYNDNTIINMSSNELVVSALPKTSSNFDFYASTKPFFRILDILQPTELPMKFLDDYPFPLVNIEIPTDPLTVIDKVADNNSNLSAVSTEIYNNTFTSFGSVSIIPFSITPSEEIFDSVNLAFALGHSPTLVMPTNQLAKYNGQLTGLVQSLFVSGEINFDVNFINGLINGSFAYTATDEIFNGGGLIEATINGNGFKGGVNTNDGQLGTINGQFYGPNATELAGALRFKGENTLSTAGSVDPTLHPSVKELEMAGILSFGANRIE